MTPARTPDPRHAAAPEEQARLDEKVRLYGASDFAQGYFRRTALSATGQLIRQEEEAILRELVPPGNGALVVDVGTGNGRLLPVLRRMGYRPLGADLSLSMMAADAAPSEQRLRADARRLPFGDGTIGGILAHRLLYHYQDYGSLLAEFARVVRPGGWICADILTWTPSVLARRVGLRSGRLVRPIDQDELMRTAAKLGLELCGRRGAFALNPASASMLPAAVGRWVARADSLPWIPRVKVYVLLRRPVVAAAASAGSEQAAGTMLH